MTVVGVFLCSFAIAVFMHSGFGLDPFQCCSQGMYRVFSEKMSYGLFYMIWSCVLLVVDLFLDRSQLGVATFANLFLTGYIADASKAFMNFLFPAPGLALRIVLLFVGFVITCLGASLYFTSHQGVSVYDAIANGLADKKIAIRGHVIPFKYIRICTDVICVLTGMVFGLMPGIGTIITAFFMGPLIDWFQVHLARPMLGIRNA
ncbi:MAG: hypothetical protein IJ242_06520 [Clostridia bacterium]|nr:hypothetical protein [Clostridia bacterium]